MGKVESGWQTTTELGIRDREGDVVIKSTLNTIIWQPIIQFS
jgi:hypothetical protein